jgi:predicted nucleic acid-binding protein
LVANVDERDPQHDACRRLLRNHHGPLLVPMLVVAEVTYLVQRGIGVGQEIEFLRDLHEGTLTAVAVEPADWPRIIELTWQYRDLPLGTVDASVIAVAERLKVRQIATLDHRHFSVVRPAHVEAFELLP